MNRQTSFMKRMQILFFEKPESLPEWLFFILRYVFLFAFTWIFINLCFFNSSSMYVFDMPLSVTAAGIVLILLFFFVYKLKQYAQTHSAFRNFVFRFYPLIAFCGLLLLFALQFVLAKAIYRPIGWDCGAIVGAAVKGDLSSEQFYFSTYPNNLLMFSLLKNLLSAFFAAGGTDYWLFLAVVNIVLVDITIYLVFVVCKKLFGLTCGFVAYALFILIFGLSPWLVVPYSDTFAMVFCPLVLLLFLEFQQSKKLWQKGIWLFLMGFVSIVGYYIKPYTLIVLIAILLYLLVRSINRLKQFGIFALTALVIAAGIVSSGLLYNMTVKNPNANVLDYSETLPMSYYFMMGLNTAVSQGTEKTLYGAYSAQDNLFAYSLPTPEAKQTETLKAAKDRIKAYTPAGYAKFLSNKANWVFSDGTFWVEGEGYDVDQPSVSASPLSKWIQSYFRFYGANYPSFANLAQGVWVVLLFFLICPLLNNSDDYKRSIFNILRIAVLGFLLYQMLFEARSRYIIAVLPVILILSGGGFSHFHENFYSYRKDGSEQAD